MKKITLIICLSYLQAQCASDSGWLARFAGYFKFGSSLMPAKTDLLDPMMRTDILGASITTRGTTLDKLRKMAKLMGRPLEEIGQGGRVDWFSFTPNKITSVPNECNTYKIHLMPKNYSFDFIYDVAAQLLTNEILKENVPSAKFQIYHIGEKNLTEEIMRAKDASDTVAPLVALYCTSRDQAQKVLNEIYRLFGHIEGSGVRPRFNGKVTDLIWFAQGNANYKFDPSNPSYIAQPQGVQYEEPYRIYCASEESPNPNYLYHPETGEALTSIGELKTSSKF